MVIDTLRTASSGRFGWLSRAKTGARLLILALLCSPIASAEVIDDSPRHEIPLPKEVKNVIDRAKSEIKRGADAINRAVKGEPTARPQPAAPVAARKGSVNPEGAAKPTGDAGSGAIRDDSRRNGHATPPAKKTARQQASGTKKKEAIEPAKKALPQRRSSPVVKPAAQGRPDAIAAPDGGNASDVAPSRGQPTNAPPLRPATAPIGGKGAPSVGVLPVAAAVAQPSESATGAVNQPPTPEDSAEAKIGSGDPPAKEAKSAADEVPAAGAAVAATAPLKLPAQGPIQSPSAPAAVAGPWQDCESCPEYVPVEGTAADGDQPGFAQLGMTKNEITFAQYDAFCDDTSRPRADDAGWGRESHPVINVTFDDATAYAAWLSERTGVIYRLPSDAEWEHAARAGTTAAYWWGDEAGRNQANCANCGSQWDGRQTAPVGSFKPNPWGLNDTVGNVWEWTSSGYPASQSPRLLFIHGGSWNRDASTASAAYRVFNSKGFRNNNLGFRLVRTVEHPGHLRVTVNVPTRVRVNGQSRGEVRPEKPLLLLNLNAGQYRIEAQAAGFSPEVETRAIAANTVTNASIVLLAIPEPPKPVTVATAPTLPASSTAANAAIPKPPAAAEAAPTLRASPTNIKGDQFLHNANGTVSDRRSGLMWMRCSVGQSWSGQTCLGEPRLLDWRGANAERGNSFLGSSDWRLPTLEELQTLVYCSKGISRKGSTAGTACGGTPMRPTIDLRAFPNTSTGSYWSSTLSMSPNKGARYVDFYDGGSGILGTENARSVRLVRNER